MMDLQEGEKIVEEKRRHWFVVVGKAIPLLILAVLPLLVLFLFFQSGLDIEILNEYLTTLSDIMTIEVVVFLYAVWLLILWMFFFVVWTNYFLDTLTITTKRLIDTDQVSLFNREQSTVPLRNIQDITVEVAGLIPTIFNFGNLHIQTAGTTKEVLVRNIDSPQQTKKLIMNTYGREADN